jgi:mRNA interferase MazF
MRYGIMYKQGDILLIPIPFTDLTSSKKRPVLVLSNDDYNSKTDDIIVVAITSNLTSKDYSVFITNSDLVEGNLKVDSCIRVDKIYTLAQNIVIKKFGEVNDDVINEIKNRINELIK